MRALAVGPAKSELGLLRLLASAAAQHLFTYVDLMTPGYVQVESAKK
jgi:hypothetical protein